MGDITHTLPVVRTLQKHWPTTALTWIIGKTEYSLVHDIPAIEFIVFDKRASWRDYRKLRLQLARRHFDVLLHLQMSLRASMIALLVNSPIKLGFDKARAKDLQWLFTTDRIAAQPRQHVIDSLLGFSQALGLTDPQYRWDIPIPQDARYFADQQLPGSQPTLVISPCSSMAYRNWEVAGYAAVADYAVQQLDMRVVLSGGPSQMERDYARQIQQAAHVPLIDLIGKTDLKQLLAVLARARVVIAPDAGTAHLANALQVPVIGLYACTNPDRARPYCYPQFVVNKYPQAVQATLGKSVHEIPWGTRVRQPGTMGRILPHEVITMLHRVLQAATESTYPA